MAPIVFAAHRRAASTVHLNVLDVRTMTKTLRELDTALDELAGSLPAQLADLRPNEHADALAPLISALLADTPAAHYDHVWGRLKCIQRDAGLISGDDEPCRESL